MHRLDEYPIWLGNTGDIADIRSVLNQGIRAIVDLALNDPVPQLPRDVFYCRFPLVDGAGNGPWMMVSAIDMVANLMKLEVPTLVFCSGGISRSPAIVAAALSAITGLPPDECLKLTVDSVAHDINPGFWNDVVGICRTWQKLVPTA